MRELDFAKIKYIYFVGIKGGGMTALALLFKGLGKKVLGSDTSEKFFTDQVLKKHNIGFIEKFNSKEITTKIDLVIYSTAYLIDENQQLIKSKKLNIPMLSYPEALGFIMKKYKTIGVAGTHGKTTVTAILAFILKQANLDPSAIVGSNVPQFAGNGLIGRSEYLVVETDEYQNKFQHYNPQALLINNIEWDHPDFFSSPEEYYQAFAEYIKKVPEDGFIIANIDDDNLAKLIQQVSIRVITVSHFQDADWQAKDFKHSQSKQSFFIIHKGEPWGRVEIKLFGDFNISNALMAIAAATELGAVKDVIIAALKDFAGTERRFEFKGEYKGVQIFDDFAHHPSEIKATLKMAKNKFADKNIITVFHPHTYTRTAALIEDFKKAFADSNQVLVLDVYPSAREKIGAIDSRKLVDMINEVSSNAIYVPTIEKVVEFFRNKLSDKDVIITMGAGDVWRVGEKLISEN